jgi:hypothetical protein
MKILEWKSNSYFKIVMGRRISGLPLLLEVPEEELESQD